jgi:hypothetical protein
VRPGGVAQLTRQGISFFGEKHSSVVVYKMTYIICIVCVLKG